MVDSKRILFAGCVFSLMSSVFISHYSNNAISGGIFHDIVKDAVSVSMAMATLFAFLVTAREWVNIMVNTDDDLRLTTQPGGVPVSLPNEDRKTTNITFVCSGTFAKKTGINNKFKIIYLMSVLAEKL